MSISRSPRVVWREMVSRNIKLMKAVFNAEEAAESDFRILFTLAEIDEL